MGASDADTDQFFAGRAGVVTLAIAYVAVGVGLLYSLTTDSTAVLAGVLVATLAVVALSLYVLYRREGLLTAENELIRLFVLVAMGLLLGLTAFTGLPSEVVIGVGIVVGVLVPGLLLEYTDLGGT